MENIKNYTKVDIEKMDYNQLIGLVRETNRTPGGYKSLARIAQNSFLKPDSRVLEIGTSTGITSIELASTVGCKLNAIDINPVSIEEAKARAKRKGVDHLIDFEIQDATNTTFADGTFDMVFCGNVTSLISNREKAFQEYNRVLKEGKCLAAIPMYYIKQPSEKLLDDVRAAIQVNIIPWDKKYWFDFFTQGTLDLVWYENYKFDYIEDAEIEKFTDDILSREHLKELNKDAYETLVKKYKEYMFLFRDNLSHMGYSLMLLRKEDKAIDPELFTSTLVL